MDEEVTADTSGGSSELTMITEVWIEPQHGSVANGTPERLHYDGCTFSQWPDRVSHKSVSDNPSSIVTDTGTSEATP